MSWQKKKWTMNPHQMASRYTVTAAPSQLEKFQEQQMDIVDQCGGVRTETMSGNESKKPTKSALKEVTLQRNVSPVPGALDVSSCDGKEEKDDEAVQVGRLESQSKRAIKKKFHKMPAHVEFLNDDLTVASGADCGENGEEVRGKSGEEDVAAGGLRLGVIRGADDIKVCNYQGSHPSGNRCSKSGNSGRYLECYSPNRAYWPYGAGNSNGGPSGTTLNQAAAIATTADDGFGGGAVGLVTLGGHNTRLRWRRRHRHVSRASQRPIEGKEGSCVNELITHSSYR